MPGAQRWAVELRQASTLKVPIDAGVGEIFVMQRAAPGSERFAGGEDHRALALVTVVDDVEEDVGSVGATARTKEAVSGSNAGSLDGLRVDRELTLQSDVLDSHSKLGSELRISVLRNP